MAAIKTIVGVAIVGLAITAGVLFTQTSTQAASWNQSITDIRLTAHNIAAADRGRTTAKSGEANLASSNVSFVFEVSIKAGASEKLNDLIVEMSDHAHTKEPGTLIYEWTVSEEGLTGHFFERYADSQAALTHLATYNEKFVDRLMALVEPGQLTVYGNPNAALKQELAGAKPIYMESAGGFAR